MQPDHLVGHGKAESRSVHLGGEEGFKDPGPEVFRGPGAMVTNPDLQRSPCPFEKALYGAGPPPSVSGR
jgi:hypothetical protein